MITEVSTEPLVSPAGVLPGEKEPLTAQPKAREVVSEVAKTVLCKEVDVDAEKQSLKTVSLIPAISLERAPQAVEQASVFKTLIQGDFDEIRAKRRLSEFSAADEALVAKMKKTEKEPVLETKRSSFALQKEDLQEKISVWQGEMLNCFQGILWIGARWVINHEAESFKKDLSKAQDEGDLKKVIRIYKEKLEVQESLIPPGEAAKKIESAIVMLNKVLDTLRLMRLIRAKACK